MRTLLKVLAVNANVLVPTTGIDIVRLLGMWYETVDTASKVGGEQKKNLKALQNMVLVMS